MNKKYTFSRLSLAAIASVFLIMGCANKEKERANRDNILETNIKAYTYTWDEIMNKRRLDMFNDSNFTKDVVMHVSPKDLVGIDSARAYYANFLTGFSQITFTIKDVFGQGNKLVKRWNFKGKHTGVFFGIPPRGKEVEVDGVTLVRMQDGKIAEETDFYDNLSFMQQLGLIPASSQSGPNED